jgi:nicotinate-nucleotide--dimethylbenzimidazole phosphoribosyltransferase
MIDAAAVWAHLDALAKPMRSLGALEALAVRLAVAQQRLDPVTHPRRIVLFAADHGVVAQAGSGWSHKRYGTLADAEPSHWTMP